MLELKECFRILRVRVEDQAPVPAVVVVSSALREDGAGYVACGLARAFAEASHRTLLIDADGGDLQSIDELSVMRVPGLDIRPMTLKGEPQIAASALVALRAEFDVVVVVAPPVPDSSLALALARAADGVILAVRVGRRKTEEDAEMMRLLVERRILGVVPNGHHQRPATRPARAGFPQPVADMYRRLVVSVRAVRAML